MLPIFPVIVKTLFVSRPAVASVVCVTQWQKRRFEADALKPAEGTAKLNCKIAGKLARCVLISSCFPELWFGVHALTQKAPDE
jgi:hypothetical protein